MSVKGIRQLKSIRFYFWDFGGSSRGARKWLQSDSLFNYIKHKHFNFDIYMKRGKHPYMSATYINGYVKDIPLRNLEEDLIIGWVDRAYNSMGRKALKHNIAEVSSDHPSIQGKWHDELWNKYPKHEMEKKRMIPEFDETPFPDIPRKSTFRNLPHHLRMSRRKDRLNYPND